MRDVGEEFALESVGFEEGEVFGFEFPELHVEGPVAFAESVMGEFESCEHFVEGGGEAFEFVTGAYFFHTAHGFLPGAGVVGGCFGFFVDDDVVGGIAEGADRLEDEALGDEVEGDDGDDAGHQTCGDDEDAIEEQGGAGLSWG